MDKDLTGQDAWERLAYEKEQRSTYFGMAVRARRGDKECAMKLVEAAVVVVEQSPLLPDVRDYLLECFNRIVGGESPDHAFNWKQSGTPGAKENFWKDIRDSDMAKGVQYLLQEGEAADVDEACEQVAKSYTAFADIAGKVGFSAVKKAYNRFFPVEDK